MISKIRWLLVVFGVGFLSLMGGGAALAVNPTPTPWVTYTPAVQVTSTQPAFLSGSCLPYGTLPANFGTTTPSWLWLDTCGSCYGLNPGVPGGGGSGTYTPTPAPTEAATNTPTPTPSVQPTSSNNLVDCFIEQWDWGITCTVDSNDRIKMRMDLGTTGTDPAWRFKMPQSGNHTVYFKITTWPSYGYQQLTSNCSDMSHAHLYFQNNGGSTYLFYDLFVPEIGPGCDLRYSPNYSSGAVSDVPGQQTFYQIYLDNDPKTGGYFNYMMDMELQVDRPFDQPTATPTNTPQPTATQTGGGGGGGGGSNYCASVNGEQSDEQAFSFAWVMNVGDEQCGGWDEPIELGDDTLPPFQLCFQPVSYGNLTVLGWSFSLDTVCIVVAAALIWRYLRTA